MRCVILRSFLIASLFASVVPTRAADTQHPGPLKPTNDSDETWSYQPPAPSPITARTIVQQKAEIRAQQRMDRLAALNWYGTSNSRPILLGTPFFSNRYNAAGDVPYIRPHDYYEAYQLPFTTRVIDR